MFLHRSHIAQRDGSAHPVKAGETNIAGSIFNDIAIQVGERSVGTDLRGNIFVSEETLVVVIPTRLVGKQIRLARSTESIPLCTMKANADKVRRGLSGIRLHFLSFGRGGTKDGGDVDADI